MLGYIWLFLIISSVIIAGINGRIDALTESILKSATAAVDISISLIGIMAFWLGIMKLAEASGLISIISKLIKPIARWLFPQVPADDPAIGSIAMNFSANALGLTNAATPIGIKAMEELQKLNPQKDVATNAMCTFLAMNTAGFQLVPATIIAVLAAAGAKNPATIIGPTILASGFALICALTTVKLLEKLPFFKTPKQTNAIIQEETCSEPQ